MQAICDLLLIKAQHHWHVSVLLFLFAQVRNDGRRGLVKGDVFPPPMIFTNNPMTISVSHGDFPNQVLDNDFDDCTMLYLYTHIHAVLKMIRVASYMIGSYVMLFKCRHQY